MFSWSHRTRGTEHTPHNPGRWRQTLGDLWGHRWWNGAGENMLERIQEVSRQVNSCSSIRVHVERMRSDNGMVWGVCLWRLTDAGAYDVQVHAISTQVMMCTVIGWWMSLADLRHTHTQTHTDTHAHTHTHTHTHTTKFGTIKILWMFLKKKKDSLMLTKASLIWLKDTV